MLNGRKWKSLIFLFLLLSPALFASTPGPISTCQTLDTAGTYTLTADITGRSTTCFTVTAVNVVLDGQGHDVNGTGAASSYGVYSTVSGTTVKNIKINEFYYAIYFYYADNGRIQNVSADIASGSSAISLKDANYIQIINSTGSSNSQQGINLLSSSNNNITGSTGTSNTSSGIFLTFSSNNSIINSNGSARISPGIGLSSSSNNNIINLMGISNTGLGISLSSSSNNSIINSTGTSNTSYGIYLTSSSNNSIINSTGTSTYPAIYLISNSNYNQIINSTGTSTISAGIVVHSSSNNSIINSTFTSTSSAGILITTRSNNTIIRNTTINASTYGIYIPSSDSTNNSIFHNYLYRASTYIYNLGGASNTFNTTAGGTAQGNYYDNILTKEIYDYSPADNYGDIGGDYPYSLSGGYYDWGPIGARYNSGEAVEIISGCQALANFPDVRDKIFYLNADPNSGGTCFNVTGENITLDCQGHTITNTGETTPGASAVYSNGTNTTIRNCIISGFYYGAHFHGANYSTIRDNTFYKNTNSGYAIYFNNLTSSNNITGNNIYSNGTAFYSNYSGNSNASFHTIKSNTIRATGYGMHTSMFFDSNVSYNNFTANESSALYISSAHDTGSIITHDVFSNNKITSYSANPAVYLYYYRYTNITNNHIILKNSSATGIRLINSALYNSIINNTIEGGNTSIRLEANSNYIYGNYLLNASTYYVNTHATSGNDFEETVGAVDRGNYYDDINSYWPNILDTNADNYADASIGGALPYQASTKTKWNGSASSDSAPIQSIPLLNASISLNTNAMFAGDEVFVYGKFNFTNRYSNYMNRTNLSGYAYDVYLKDWNGYETLAVSGTTNDTGHYNSSFTVPTEPGNYTLIVNSTYFNETTNIGGAYGVVGRNTTSVLFVSTNIRSCTNLNISGRSYVLNESFSTSASLGCINITAENITLDCQGYMLNGNNATDTYGIYSISFNTTIQNCRIENFSTGIYLNGADNGTITDTTAFTTRSGDETDANGKGILLRASANYNTISNSNFTSTSGYGICLSTGSNYTQIIGSSAISNSQDAIIASSSSSNLFNSTYASSNTKSAYNLTNNLGNNTIDCGSSFILNGTNTTNTYGIYSDSFNTTILNCRIENYSTGIYSTAGSSTVLNTSAFTSRYGDGISNGYGMFISESAPLNSGSLIINSSAVSNANGTAVLLGGAYSLLENSNATSTAGAGVRLFSTYLANVSYANAVGSPAIEINGQANSFSETSQADFAFGTPAGVSIASQSGNITLTPAGSQYTSDGTYTSRIFDGSTAVNWTSANWSEAFPYGEELPDNRQVETVQGGANMGGNTLLIHTNNAWTDTSSSGYNPTAFGATFTNSSKFGSYAGSFDGNDYVRVTTSGGPISATAAFTICAWIYPTSDNAAQTIYGASNWQEGSWALRFDKGSAYVTNGAATPEIQYNSYVPVNKWSHICLRRVTNYYAYVNGIYVGWMTNFDPRPVIIQLVGACPGRNSGSGTYHAGVFFNGRIDELATFNRALTPTEIVTMYQRGAYRLNMSARSCDDAECSGESWTEGYENATYNFLNLSQNRYFQYKFSFNTSNISSSPVLNDVSISYLRPENLNLVANSNATSVSGSGIYINGSSNNSIADSISSSTSGTGILLNQSSGSVIAGGSASSGTGSALALFASPYSFVENLSAVSTSGNSTYIFSSNYSNFTNNTISGAYGFYMRNTKSVFLVGNAVSATINSFYLNGTSETANTSLSQIENNTINNPINLTEFTYENFGCGSSGSTVSDSGTGNAVYAGSTCGAVITITAVPSFVVKGANVSVNGTATFGDSLILNKAIAIFFNGTQVADSNMAPAGPPQTNSTGRYNYTFNATNVSWTFSSFRYASGEYNISVNITEAARTANATKNITLFEYYPSLATNRSSYDSAERMGTTITLATDNAGLGNEPADAIFACIGARTAPSGCSVFSLNLANPSEGTYTNTTNLTNIAPGNYSLYMNVSIQGIVLTNITNITVDNDTPRVENVSTSGLNAYNYTSASSSYTVTFDIGENIALSSVLCEQNGVNYTADAGAGNSHSCSLTAPSAGNYNITIYANDTARHSNSSRFEMSTVATTTVSMVLSGSTLPPISITDLSPGYYFIYNITLNDTGSGKAHLANVSNSTNTYSQYINAVTSTENCTESINYSYGTCVVSFNITVDELTPQATYYIYFNGRFTNNDLTIGNLAEKALPISITGNPILTTIELLNTSINHSETDRFNISLNSTGNAEIVDTEITYIEETALTGWFVFAPAAIASLGVGERTNLSLNITVPAHYAPGNYTGHFDLNISNGNDVRINISISVPASLTWNLSPFNQTNTSAIDQTQSTAPLGTARINNTGNVELNFTIGYTGSFVGTAVDPESNPSAIQVPAGVSYNLTPNFIGSLITGSWTLNITLTNTSASPTTNYTTMYLVVEDQPPVVAPQINITNASNYAPINVTDANIQIRVNFSASDDQTQIDYNNVHCNFTLNSATEKVSATRVGLLNSFYCLYTPQWGGAYNISVHVPDTGNKYGNGSILFIVYGNTSMRAGSNITTAVISGMSQSSPKTFSFEISANNTGYGTAINATGYGLPSNSSWGSTICNFTNITNNSKQYANITITIPAGTEPGTYYVTPYIRWTNPDRSNFTNYTADITVSVQGNPELLLQFPSAANISQGSSSNFTLIVNSTGISNVSGINLTCSGAQCTAFSVAFNESALFSLGIGQAKPITVTLTASAGKATGAYPNLYLNATSTEGASHQFTSTINVLADYNWTVSRSSINTSNVINAAGTLATTISNNGNENLAFLFNLSGNATGIFVLEDASQTVLAGTNYTLNITYSLPGEPASYYGNLTLNETHEGATLNYTIPIDYRVFVGSMNISPNSTVKQVNISAGDTIYINATILAGDDYVNENATFSVQVNGTSCPVSAYANFSGQNLWQINCTAPSANDGQWHNLTVIANYSTMDILITNTTQSSLHYLDITLPAFLASRINISGTSAFFQINASDNVNVSTVKAYVLSQNITVNHSYNYTYEFNMSGLSVGDYDVYYWISDAQGNSNTSSGYFEIWTDAGFAGDIKNSSSQPVSAGFTLYRPATSQVLQNFSTNSNGAYSAVIHSRTYDAVVFSSQMSMNITLQEIELSSYSDSLDFDRIGKWESSLVNGVNGIGVRTNFTGGAAISISFDSGELSGAEEYIKMYKCAGWNFSTKTCSGTWGMLTTVVDKVYDRVYANVSQFSDTDGETAYMLGETVTTSGQPDISLSSIDSLSVQHNATGRTNFTITSSGTGTALNIYAVCSSGTICEMADTAMAPAYIASIAQGGIETVNINVSIPYAHAPGTYLANIIAYGDGISNKTAQLQVTVPTNASWSINQTFFNATVGTGETTIGYARIYNNGNVNLRLNSSTNDTSAYANETDIQIPKNSTSHTIRIYSNATAPGNMTVGITIANASASPASLTLNATLRVINMTVLVSSPNSSLPAAEIIPGATLNISANAYLEGAELTSGATWSAAVGGADCTSPSYSYSTSAWLISCLAPDITTLNNSIVVEAQYGGYGGADTEAGAVIYTDTTPPSIIISAASAYKGAVVAISLLPSDNAGVSGITANLTHPNGTVDNLTLTYSAPYYTNSFATIDAEYGMYTIRAWANDTSGLNGTNSSTFNVMQGAYIAGNFTSANGSTPTVEIWILDNASNVMFVFNTSGIFNQSVNATNIVNLQIKAFGQSITLTGVNMSQNVSSLFSIDSLTPNYVGGGALTAVTLTNISTNYTGGSITMDYSGTSYASESNVGLYKCSTWDFATRLCTSGWERLTSVSVDRLNHKITANISSFSAYAAAEYICGDGVCHSAYGEGSANCPADCPVTTQTVSVTTGGSSGGSSSYSTTNVEGASEAQLQEIQDKIDELQGMQPDSEEFNQQLSLLQEMYENLSEKMRSGANISTEGMETMTNSIYFELYPGEETTTSTTIKNTLGETSTISIQTAGNIKSYVYSEQSSITLEPYAESEVALFVSLPADTKPGVYYGSIEFENEAGGRIQVPFNLRVLQLKDRLLDLKIQPIDSTVEPGGKIRIETNIYNLGEARRVDAQLKVQLIQQENEKIVAELEEALAIETSLSSIKTMDVPADTPEGKYVLRAVATYPVSSGLSREATSISTIDVRRSLTPLFVFLFAVVLAAGGYAMWKRMEKEKKRFLVKIDFSKLPKFDERAAFLGKVAETNVRAAFPVDKLVMHALVAGASGSGKTVAAQDIVEEVLKKKISVVVFDPTAQWTGFLRKNSVKEMLSLYKDFGMNASDACAFPGNVFIVKDPNRKINIKELMKPGEITIFALNNFKSVDIETIVANTIEEVFALNLEESKELRLLIVFDEVHRLLPKFGGTGAGFKNIERSVREFRKWGVGMLLVSQVLSDFVGEIKTNISTEVQLRTKYEEDLNRIKMKYGEEILKYIVKAPVGVGMLQNAEFNRGNPYFVLFRPLLHSIVRLSDKALEKYHLYNERIMKVIEGMEKLKAKEVDVFDVELELKLARDKLNKGSFEVVEIYLESLEKKVGEMLKKL